VRTGGRSAGLPEHCHCWCFQTPAKAGTGGKKWNTPAAWRPSLHANLVHASHVVHWCYACDVVMCTMHHSHSH
jgi:hypothetical protein